LDYECLFISQIVHYSHQNFLDLFIYDQLKVVINHLKGLTLTCFAPSIVLFAPVS